MKSSSPWIQFMIGCILIVFIAGCAAVTPENPPTEPTTTFLPPSSTTIPPTVTPAPPTNTPEPISCKEVEGICLELSFDGESCTYVGPTDLKSGPVTLLFLNKSEDGAMANLVRHTGDKTYQDMIDYIGEEPSKISAPVWADGVPGVLGEVKAGESRIWEGVLEQGIHTLLCINLTPFGVWLGVGLTVED